MTHFSRPSLHPPVISSPDDKQLAETQLSSLLARQASSVESDAAATLGSIQVPLTTVSKLGNFDSYISVGFRSTSGTQKPVSMLFDTGNIVLVAPYWEAIEALPDWQSNYQVLCAGTEPWWCPANVVRGPIEISTRLGQIYTLSDCIFYACTGDVGNGRTANFGAGRISSPTQVCDSYEMQTPLMYNSIHPYAEIDLAPAESILAESGDLKVASGSLLKLHKDMPTGYSLFDIIPDKDWMSLIPKALSIGKTKTGWPAQLRSPIAMVDTGGGPANLSDPQGHLSNRQWPDEVPNPDWVNDSVGDCKGSTNCKSTKTDITIEMGDESASITYEINTSVLPNSVRGLTLVMCQNNCFMEGQNGMNIGGISALSLSVLIDYQNGRVGLKKK